jgi:hypothetical protein
MTAFDPDQRVERMFALLEGKIQPPPYMRFALQGPPGDFQGDFVGFIALYREPDGACNFSSIVHLAGFSLAAFVRKLSELEEKNRPKPLAISEAEKAQADQAAARVAEQVLAEAQQEVEDQQLPACFAVFMQMNDGSERVEFCVPQRITAPDRLYAAFMVQTMNHQWES